MIIFLAASKILLSSASILTLSLNDVADSSVFEVGFSILLISFILMPKLPLRGTSISLVSTSSTVLGGSSKVKLPLSGLCFSTGLHLL
jgi:hypothetical protein